MYLKRERSKPNLKSLLLTTLMLTFQIKKPLGTQETFFGLEDVLKKSSTSLQRNSFVSSKTCWRHLVRRLQDVLEDEKLLCWRRLGDVLKTCLEGVLKTCLETSWRYVLNTSWRHFLKTSWWHHGGKQNTYWEYLYLTNLNVYLRNLYFTNLHLTILRRIQNVLITAQ